MMIVMRRIKGEKKPRWYDSPYPYIFLCYFGLLFVALTNLGNNLLAARPINEKTLHAENMSVYTSTSTLIMGVNSDELTEPTKRKRRRLAAFDEGTGRQIKTQPRNTALTFPFLDTRFFVSALENCGNDIDCVLAQIPIHGNRNCSQAVFGLHHMMGEELAHSLQWALPCSGNTIYYNMDSDDYERGRPTLHFIRDPLEVVVSGYQDHLVSNASWLETYGLKKKLNEKSLEKGLELEYRDVAIRNIQNSQKVYRLMKENRNTQLDFFTIRTDQLREERMFNLTTQAIQVWLGVSDPISWEEMQACCFIPSKIGSLERDKSVRQIVMDKHAGEIYGIRKRLDFPRVGLEIWTRPDRNCGEILLRVLVAALLGTFSVLIPVCFLRVFTHLASAFLRNRKDSFGKSVVTEVAASQGGTRADADFVSASCNLATRCCYELSWRTPLFALRDPFLCYELDVQQTFAPWPIWKTRMIRMALLLWSLQIFWIDMHLFQFHWFYLAFLSQLTFVLTIGYFFVATCVAFAGPLRQSDGYGCSGPGVLVCVHWVWFSSIIVFQFVVTTMFWATNTHYFLHILSRSERYPSLMKHGGFFLLTVWEGLVQSRIPLRAKLLVFPWLIISLYGFWTVYQSFYGPSNPFFYGQDHENQDDDAIYPHFNWKKRPAGSFLYLVIGHVLSPIFYSVLWVISAWSGRWRWDGSHRRFVVSETLTDVTEDAENDGIELEGLLLAKVQ